MSLGDFSFKKSDMNPNIIVLNYTFINNGKFDKNISKTTRNLYIIERQAYERERQRDFKQVRQAAPIN